MDWSRLRDKAWRAEAVPFLRRCAVVRFRNAVLSLGAAVMLVILLAGLPVLVVLAMARLDISAGLADMQDKLRGMRDSLREENDELDRQYKRLFA